MRLIKRQSTNLRNVSGPGIHYDASGQVILETSNVMLVPKGTTAARPVYPTNGHLRYNTTTNEFELYQDSAWRQMRFKEPTAIVQQTLGTGDDTETVFGPLDSGDTAYPVPETAQSIIVLIENVFQIATTNYTLEQSSSGNLTGPNSPYADGWYIKFTSAVPLGKPVTVIHNFDK